MDPTTRSRRGIVLVAPRVPSAPRRSAAAPMSPSPRQTPRERRHCPGDRPVRGSLEGTAKPLPRATKISTLSTLLLCGILRADVEGGPATAVDEASLVPAPTRRRNQASEVPVGLGTSYFCEVLRVLQRPGRGDEVRSRVLAPTQIGGASRCQVRTRWEGRFAIARGRQRTPWRTCDCAAAPRFAPTCFASPPGAAGPAGAPCSPGNRAMTARAPRSHCARRWLAI